MSFEKLKKVVWQANKDLSESGLILFTWGNVSGIDRKSGVMAIKPSGVDYEKLKPEDIVILSLDDGEIIEGSLRPSSDTPTHLVLYQNFKNIGGIVHTHSLYATSWAQAGKEIPCFGTTHADHFYRAIPVTRQLTNNEIETDYEQNTGEVIVERFLDGDLDPEQAPGVLVPNHGVFTWGPAPMKALKNAIILEEIAKMALYSTILNPHIKPISQTLLNKHFLRKHGPGAYYGQEDIR